MILVDANLLLYAYDTSSSNHRRARRWLEGVLSGQEPVRLAWVTILAFLRIRSDARVYRRPLSMVEASAIVQEWLALPNVAPLEPSADHWRTLSGVLVEGQVRGPLVMDAHLAALAIEHGATLCTSDRDFNRFPRLRVEFPLD